MNRSSLIHYIDPSAIGITPNVNNSANDLEVYIAQGCKIQVYCPRVGLDFDAATNKPQEWTLKGRNRRLVPPASGDCPYTIYARLPKNDKGAGYLVFAPKDFLGGKWVDKYVYVTDTTASGLTKHGYDPVTDEWWPRFKDNENWYFKLGDVSLPENNERTLTIDTGLLGTEEFNNKWALNPDSLPLRIELQSTIADDQQPPVTRDGGTAPYVYWGETLTLTALLTEGWTGTDIQRFDHWEIRRDSGDAVADATWAEAASAGEFRSTGVINLVHGRGAETRDDFNSAVNTTFTVMAMERTDDPEAGGEPEYAVLKQASFCIMAEVWEGYELSADTLMVTFNPRNGQYSPSGNIKFRIRATDQASDVFMMTNGQYAAAGLHAEYAPIDDSQNWTPITISGSESATAEGEVPATAFSTHQKSINVRLKNAAMKELDRFTIAFLKDGEDSREREWIYRLDTSAGYSNTTGTIGGDPSHPVSGQTGGVDNCRLVDDFVPENWTDEPTGTSSSHDTEYASYRDYDHDNDRWGAFATPKPWSHYGQDGDDGLYYKNEYARSKSRTSHAAADIDTSYGTSGWGTAAPSATDTYPYIWKRTRQWNPNTNNWATGSSWTYVCETGEDGPAGSNGDTPIQLFKWSQTPLTAADKPAVDETDWATQDPYSGWYKQALNRPSGDGYILYMSQNTLTGAGTIDSTAWSTPIQISGTDGTPGEDGKEREWIYRLDTNTGYASTTGTIGGDSTKPVSGQTGGIDNCRLVDDFVPTNWSDNPLGVSKNHPTEYASFRIYDHENDRWGAFQTPIIWSHWGRNGMDGDGTEYVFIRTKEFVEPIIADEGSSYLADEWKPLISNGAACDAEKHNNEYRTTDDPTGTDDTYKYEWVAKRTMSAADATTGQRTWKSYRECIGSPYKMSLWNNYAESNLIIDLDNQEDQFGTDSENEVIGNQVRSTGVSLYYGTQEQAIVGTNPLTAQLFYASDDGETTPISDTSIAEVSCVVDSQDNTKGTVTVTIKDGAVITDTGLFAKVTAKCARDNNGKTAYFNLGKVKSGAQGVSPTIYQLELSQKSLSYGYDSNNNLVAKNNSVTVSVKETIGNDSQIKTLAQSGKTCTWGYDGTYNTYTVNPSNPVITVAAGDVGNHTKISIQLSTGDKEELPIVKDGKYGSAGQNSVRLALDNEHEDFLYSDSQALPIAPSGGATSAIHLYDGETEQSSGFTLEVDFTKSSGIPGSSAEHKPTISNGVLTVPHITADAAKVVVKATYKSKYYYADFTANKTSQDKYDLYVRPNAIPYNPASYTPMTLAFEAERTDLQGKKTSATISTSSSGRYVAGNLYLFFGYVKADGSIVNPTGQPTPLYEWADIPVAASVCSAYVGIYFELRLYTSASAYRMCDHETVEIAKTQNGANAPYYVVDYGRASSRSLNQQGTPSGFDSTTGWQNTAPDTNDDFPYIWERSRYYNSAGTLQSTSYTCLTGETGDDGISVFTDPTNILIRQVAKPQGNTDADFGLPMDVGFEVKEGATYGTITNIYINAMSGITVVRKSADHTKAQITDVVPVTSGGDNTEFPTKGFFTCTIYYTISGINKNVQVKVSVYIDPIGNIVTTIEGDVERTVAHDIGYAIDPSGGIQSLDQVGTYIRSASEMTSELSKKVGEGKNLLTGVLTGEGWELTGRDIETNEDDEFIIGSGSLESPSGLSVGEEDGYYTLSYEAARAGTVQFYVDGVEVYDVPVTTGYLNGRYYLTFNTQWADDYLDGELTFIFSGQTYIRHPQLETGEVATAFDAGTTETTSRIHQTAENIEMKVEDCGVDIDHQSIVGTANKFKIRNNVSSADGYVTRQLVGSNVQENTYGQEQTFGVDTFGTLTSPVGAALQGASLKRNTAMVSVDHNNDIEYGDWFKRIYKKEGSVYTLQTVRALYDTIVLFSQLDIQRTAVSLIWLPPAKEIVGQELTIVNAAYGDSTTPNPTVKVQIVDFDWQQMTPTWAYGDIGYGFMWPKAGLTRTFYELNISDYASITLRAVPPGFTASSYGDDDLTGEWVVISATKRQQ